MSADLALMMLILAANRARIATATPAPFKVVIPVTMATSSLGSTVLSAH